MSSGPLAPLAEQRRLLREQMGTQRQVLAQDLAAAGVGGGYPRSITMRWLIQEPELVARLVKRAAGGRVAAAVPVVLILARFLRSAVV